MKIAIIGAGAMGGATVEGLLKCAEFQNDNITVADPNQQVIDSFAEIIYYGSEGEECCFRVGADTEDISGEHDGYTTAETEVINGCEVTLKGSGKRFTLVSWTDGGHFYSVSLVNGTDKADLLEIADEIMNAET